MFPNAQCHLTYHSSGWEAYRSKRSQPRWIEENQQLARVSTLTSFEFGGTHTLGQVTRQDSRVDRGGLPQ
jgi:hypothetical protein